MPAIGIARDEAYTRDRKRLMPSTPRPASRDLVRRCGEQSVHARRVGAVARHHVVGRDHIAQALRHLGAALDHHALGKQPLDRLVEFLTSPMSRITFVQKRE